MAVVSRRAEGILGQLADGSWRFAGVGEQVLWHENCKESVTRCWENRDWSARFFDVTYAVFSDSHSWGRYDVCIKLEVAFLNAEKQLGITVWEESKIS